jgi:hypothetical protein
MRVDDYIPPEECKLSAALYSDLLMKRLGTTINDGVEKMVRGGLDAKENSSSSEGSSGSGSSGGTSGGTYLTDGT